MSAFLHTRCILTFGRLRSYELNLKPISSDLLQLIVVHIAICISKKEALKPSSSSNIVVAGLLVDRRGTTNAS